MQKNSAKLHLPSLLRKIPYLLILLGLSISPAFAACHTVSPAGSGAKTGADWNNALAGLPSTLVRGDIYYLADGNYGSYTFNTATSGTTTVEIRKAQSYDNCTSTGWNTSTMGSAQAVFSGNTAFNIDTSYVTINGNGQQASPGCGGTPSSYNASGSAAATPSDCGIRETTTDTTNASIINYLANGSTNVTIEYVEQVGVGVNLISTNAANAEFGGNDYFTSNHVLGRNTGCGSYSVGQAYQVVEHSYFWYTYGLTGGACHIEWMLLGNSGTSSHDITVAYNVFRDINGQAIMAWVGSPQTVANFYIYGNVFTGPNTGFGLAGGLIWCGNGYTCNNIQFNQNTVYDMSSGNTCLIQLQSGGAISGQAYNNLIYNSPISGSGCTIDSGMTSDYNSILNSAGNGGGSPGTHNVVVNSGAPNPFVNAAAGNFSLASDGADWNNRDALGSPYNVDANGTTFTTDRGAYQYGGTTLPPPINVNGTAVPK